MQTSAHPLLLVGGCWCPGLAGQRGSLSNKKPHHCLCTTVQLGWGRVGGWGWVPQNHRRPWLGVPYPGQLQLRSPCPGEQLPGCREQGAGAGSRRGGRIQPSTAAVPVGGSCAAGGLPSQGLTAVLLHAPPSALDARLRASILVLVTADPSNTSIPVLIMIPITPTSQS